MLINFQDIIGKTDVEIFTGAGVKESQDFKREVLEKGKPAKREITFETELFGSKTFLIYVEPVFSKAGDTIGVNYLGMEITDQVSLLIYLFSFESPLFMLFVMERVISIPCRMKSSFYVSVFHCTILASFLLVHFL